MADIINDGLTKVSFVSTISSVAAPTVAELNAGTALEDYIVSDGLGQEFGTEAVETTALSSTYATSLPGRQTVSTELTLKNQGDASAPFSVLTHKAAGYLVVRRYVAASTAWTASQTVEVHPVEVGIRARIPAAENEAAKFKVKLAHTSEPTMAATVAA